MTILHTKNSAKNCRKPSDLASKSRIMRKFAPSLVVKAKDTSTAKPHGISTAERDILDTATHFLDQQFGRKNCFVVVEAHDSEERQARELIRKVKADFGQLQQRAGFPRWYVELLEGRNGVHSNIIGPLPVTYAKRLLSYYYGNQLTVKVVYDMTGLRNYLLKEATPEAVYKTGVRRDKGSHPLGDGGGDRVRLSEALRDELIDRGLLPSSLKRTYASRRLSLTPVPIAAVEAVVASMQPAVPVQPTQLDLPLDAPQVNLISLVEAKRQKLGLPQHLVARQLGGLKQSAYANALRGHDRLGAWRRNRALEWIAA